ncbi:MULTISPECIES: TOMM precursor leader peptide-binding protein [Corallococcus]|uniref:TOMM precursor leader peptide-binding protein n=1 Tax=Corallococcus TaxID=83461 RepID=UPI00117BEE7B|nr:MULTISPECIES: TOMM precursor leader peptide-binding protein [Corallococcus]NBD09293.1 TOMM precursor leader peptide-binding protein [Corallococcus silvisoli]TSC31262.1 TOMM precursor leader peptide-binding protein [Corallococcus sp. Z5C101001]
MDRVLRLKPHLRAEVIDSRRVFLVGERAQFLLEGELHASIVPLLDGQRSVAQVISTLVGRASAPEVLYALSLLEERGHVEEAHDVFDAGVAGFWESLGLDAAVAAGRLLDTAVAVRAVEGEDGARLEDALADAGLDVREDADRHVLLVDDYLSPEAEVLAREARHAGAAFLPVKVSGTACHAGPVVGPGDGACWACLTARLLDNRPIEKYLARRGSPARPPRTGLPTTAQAGLSFAATLVARWVVSGTTGVDFSRLWTLDFSTWKLEPHAVSRRPQCPECGDPAWLDARAKQPLVLASRPKRFTDDGGHRILTPEETWERHRHLISPVTGVVSDLRAVPGDAPLGHIQSAVFRVCPWTDAPASDDFHRVASGKGRTEAQARAGALCEALERHSAVFQGDEPRVHATASSLGPRAVHPDALQHFSPAQLQARTEGGARRDARTAVPQPYADQPMDWSPAWSLTHGERKYVPTSFAYLFAPAPPGGPFCLFNSNGNAAGNCVEEAILQGFLELVERDAVALWWYNRLRRPRVDLHGFGDPWFTSVEAHYQSLGLRSWVLDLTHDLGIPVFVALVWSPERGRAWAGCGSHFDAKLAVQRALTEVAQCYDPKDTSPSPWDTGAHEDPSWLFPEETAAARGAADFPRVWHGDLRDDVAECVARAARVGLETLVVEQSRPDVGVSAVKVVVPGLRHFWPRLGPGRLYDVPVRMGWLSAPLTEAQLNPVPFSF